MNRRHETFGARRPPSRRVAAALPARGGTVAAAASSGRNALRCAILALALPAAACEYIFPPPEDTSPRVDIYTDRYEYRYNRYESVRGLRLALEASGEDIARLIVQECAGTDHLPAALEMLRSRGNYSVRVVVVPKDCVEQ